MMVIEALWVFRKTDGVERVRKRMRCVDTDEIRASVLQVFARKNLFDRIAESNRIRSIHRLVHSSYFILFSAKNSMKQFDPCQRPRRSPSIRLILLTECPKFRAKFRANASEETLIGIRREGRGTKEAARLVSTTFRREFLWCRGVPCTEVRAGRADSITNGRSLR